MNDVQVDSVWKDNDKRMHERYLVVCRTDSTHAVCVRCDRFGGNRWKRAVRIRLDRFKPNSSGYSLVWKP